MDVLTIEGGRDIYFQGLNSPDSELLSRSLMTEAGTNDKKAAISKVKGGVKAYNTQSLGCTLSIIINQDGKVDITNDLEQGVKGSFFLGGKRGEGMMVMVGV